MAGGPGQASLRDASKGGRGPKQAERAAAEHYGTSTLSKIAWTTSSAATSSASAS